MFSLFFQQRKKTSIVLPDTAHRIVFPPLWDGVNENYSKTLNVGGRIKELQLSYAFYMGKYSLTIKIWWKNSSNSRSRPEVNNKRLYLIELSFIMGTVCLWWKLVYDCESRTKHKIGTRSRICCCVKQLRVRFHGCCRDLPESPDFERKI